MSLSADSITVVPFDLYRDIHKSIRATIFSVTAEAGRLDPTDRAQRVAHAGRVVDLARFLAAHAEHEDRHIDAAITEVLPDQAAQIRATHVRFEEQMDEIVDIADLVYDARRTDERAAVHHLYLALSSFASEYLAHQDVEEREVMPALWHAYGLEPMLAIHRAILASIAPPDMAWSLMKMLPAMNASDRAEMFAGMRAEAPAEAFAGMCALAQQILPETDYAALAAQVGFELATIG